MFKISVKPLNVEFFLAEQPTLDCLVMLDHLTLIF